MVALLTLRAQSFGPPIASGAAALCQSEELGGGAGECGRQHTVTEEAPEEHCGEEVGVGRDGLHLCVISGLGVLLG